jgi:hypothetical protein
MKSGERDLEGSRRSILIDAIDAVKFVDGHIQYSGARRRFRAGGRSGGGRFGCLVGIHNLTETPPRHRRRGALQRFLIPQRVAFLPDSQLRLEFGDALLQWTDQFLNLLG